MSLEFSSTEASLEFRTLNYGDVAEVRAYLEILYAISAEGDEFHFDRSEMVIDRAVIKVRREEDESNTFAGLALERPGRTGRSPRGAERSPQGAGRRPNEVRRNPNDVRRSPNEIVALHIVRRFEEGPRIGAHIGGLWVAEPWRRQGVARRLKAMGESWARSVGATFLNTNVLVSNERMLDLNRKLGFEPYRLNLRKRL
jgi:GNAT superfamily N-acetyltransferase